MDFGFWILDCLFVDWLSGYHPKYAGGKLYAAILQPEIGVPSGPPKSKMKSPIPVQDKIKLFVCEVGVGYVALDREERVCSVVHILSESESSFISV